VGGLVLLVVALGLEEEVTDLADAHREGPAEQHRQRRVREQQRVRGDEAHGAHEVERLVDPAVVVVAVVVPTLLAELGNERSHELKLTLERLDRAAPGCNDLAPAMRQRGVIQMENPT
jgi:hypothetical protein